MIAFLTGRVAGKAPGVALLDVGGVGYRLWMSTTSLSALPAEGDEVTVWTHLHVREDELSLYGFESTAERDAFAQLITVSGVGPKVALAVLSALSPEALSAAVASEDIVLLSSVPGVGRKTAQRLCLDLADKLGGGGVLAGAAASSASSAAALDEAMGALLAMGFSSIEASAALKGFDGDASDPQEILTFALKRLGRS